MPSGFPRFSCSWRITSPAVVPGTCEKPVSTRQTVGGAEISNAIFGRLFNTVAIARISSEGVYYVTATDTSRKGVIGAPGGAGKKGGTTQRRNELRVPTLRLTGAT